MMTPEEYGLELAKAAAEGMGRESVSKLTNAMGVLFPFWGLKKKAVSTYISEIESSGLPPEEKMMRIAGVKKTFRHFRNQAAIAQIALHGAGEGTDFSDASAVDSEWLDRFMDSARFVSDEKAQLLWGGVLAKEFEHPNSTPPSVVRVLTEITPRCAKAFQMACSLSVLITPENAAGQALPSVSRIMLPFDYKYLNKHDLDFSMFHELQALGLVQFNPVVGYILDDYSMNTHPRLRLSYGGRTAAVVKYEDRKLPWGALFLTEAGNTLEKFAERTVIEGHFDAVCRFLRETGVELDAAPEP